MSKASKRERQRENRELRRQYHEQLVRRRRTVRVGLWLSILAIPAIVAAVVLLSSSEENPAAAAGCREVKKEPKPKDVQYEQPELVVDATASDYIATVDTNCGSFTIDLATAEAPQTVNSFVFLAQEGFFDGITVPRVQRDFVIQTGSPTNDIQGGPGYVLPDEPPADVYLKGTVAMANSGPGTTGSQFFVLTTEDGAAGLSQDSNGDGKLDYSLLGQVTDGIETIEKINKLGSKSQDLTKQQPRTIVVIEKITVNQVVPGG